MAFLEGGHSKGPIKKNGFHDTMHDFFLVPFFGFVVVS